MQSAQQQDWMSAWPVERPLTIDYAYAGTGAPSRSIGPELVARDLGLGDASHHAMQARHVRALGAAASKHKTLHDAAAEFQFLYVLSGTLDLVIDSGARHRLMPGGVAVLPSNAMAAWDAWSADFAAIDISAAPGRHVPASKSPRTPVVLTEAPEDFVVGAGPRRYFAYRDLGTAAPTGRRIYIHVVKALEPMSAGTGWHWHTMSQLFVVLTGWADLQVEGRGERRMYAGDAMCLRAGMRHNVPAFSADYTVLEMCVPADYDTTAVDAPVNRGHIK